MNSIKTSQIVPKKNEHEIVNGFRSIVSRHRLGRNVTNEILTLFKNEIPSLPKDSRTLMRTPRNKVKILEKGIGEEFHYFGVEKSLKGFRNQYKTTGNCLSYF